MQGERKVNLKLHVHSAIIMSSCFGLKMTGALHVVVMVVEAWSLIAAGVAKLRLQRFSLHNKHQCD